MRHLTVCDEEVELAKGEAPIKGRDLLLEILPLIQDYFVGEAGLEKDCLVYRMPNGQKFSITAREQ